MALPINGAKMSDAAKRGQAIGANLAQSAAQTLLAQYDNRQGPMSPASEHWCQVWDQLHAALGVMADDPAVAAALHSLDGAHGDALVECEDQVWHAAWSAAIGSLTPR